MNDPVMEALESLVIVMCTAHTGVNCACYGQRAIAALKAEREVALNRIKELESKLEIQEAELRQARMDIETAQWRRDG